MSTSRNAKESRRVHSQQERLLILKEGEEFGVMETCQRHGIHFTTWYEWRRKYQKEGEAGLGTKGRSDQGRE
ncbi:MAG: helix-turn-helix domain-containing protein, partial [Planctomycetes bacterium]|nr:helix-turn-helix domain-containing protein [Planctomycetota bacterium]